ncbi:MAG TPA: hypothetical protein VFC63_06315 [Blastocatellia bacterium]|nr:hypothetical protein [Blastocatellia bacterium]
MSAQLLDREPAPVFVDAEVEQPKLTKKQRILQLHSEGTTDIHDLAREVGTSLNYVASVLTDAGLLTGYYDLYTSTAHTMNQYGRLFQGALSFKDVEAAKASVNRIEQLYRYFSFLNDRGGQHHAMLVALTGRNRALSCNKLAEAEIFTNWLVSHLEEPFTHSNKTQNEEKN